VVEVASIQPGNGSLATLNQGYSVGAWTALLASAGIDVTTVHVLSWKKDMGLLKRDKDCSRQLARGLFEGAGNPQDDLLRWVLFGVQMVSPPLVCMGVGHPAVNLTSDMLG
jgi:hypothetical protein